MTMASLLSTVRGDRRITSLPVLSSSNSDHHTWGPRLKGLDLCFSFVSEPHVQRSHSQLFAFLHHMLISQQGGLWVGLVFISLHPRGHLVTNSQFSHLNLGALGLQVWPFTPVQSCCLALNPLKLLISRMRVWECYLSLTFLIILFIVLWLSYFSLNFQKIKASTSWCCFLVASAAKVTLHSLWLMDQVISTLSPPLFVSLLFFSHLNYFP